MRITELLFRAWYYFRLGYSTYLNFFVGFFTFVSTTYYLAITRLPFLQIVFSHFYIFVAFTILVIIPLSVCVGWLHMKRTLAYPTEVTVSVEANPYNYLVVPGKEKEVYVPAWLIQLKAFRKILEKEGILSAEDKMEIENTIANVEKMLKGEIVGRPKQRQFADQEQR